MRHPDSTEHGGMPAGTKVPRLARQRPEPGSHAPGGRPVLVVIRGPHLAPGTEFPLSRDVISIGRQPDSTITLDDVTVSRRHAEIRRHGTTFTLRDHGSLNGTYVNRRPICEVKLVDGDEIQVGKYRLAFRANANPS